MDIHQSSGWRKLWHLSMSHKIKMFFWRFCRNNITIRNLLREKGVAVPIGCQMCEGDVENQLHLLIDCRFGKGVLAEGGFVV